MRVYSSLVGLLTACEARRTVQTACLMQSTVLREIWGSIHAHAQQENARQGNRQTENFPADTERLIQRVLSSLAPECQMVFVMDLQRPGMPSS